VGHLFDTDKLGFKCHSYAPNAIVVFDTIKLPEFVQSACPLYQNWYNPPARSEVAASPVATLKAFNGSAARIASQRPSQASIEKPA
jgi:hypothetical protein